MFNKYYQDELVYLREMGAEFARAHPDHAHFLGEAGGDPDVERLLEGFAFLAARIRQKLDDEFPELLHDLLEIFWPHYLRVLPSTTILQFEALPQAARESRQIPRGSEVQSVPVDGTPCRFRTTADVTLHPLALEDVQLRAGTPGQLRLRLKVAEGASLRKAAPASLRLHLSGDPPVARALYLLLARRVTRISAQAGSAAPVPLGGATARAGGFSPAEALLPYGAVSFPGFRLLHEYFAYPAKFMFVDLQGLSGLSALGDAAAFDLVLDLERVPPETPPFGPANLLLNCAPAVNLFGHDAEPIRLDHERPEYRVVPSGGAPRHYEVYSVDKVVGLLRGSGRPQEYRPLHRFARSGGEDTRFYRPRLARSPLGDRFEIFLQPLPPDVPGAMPEVETLSLELTCSNGALAAQLNPGDVSKPAPGSPAFARWRNLTRPTTPVPPPLGAALNWKLLSHLTLNYLSLVDLDALRDVVGLYNFRARVDRQAENAQRQMLDGLKRIAARPLTRLVAGAPVRGVAVDLEIDEDQMGGEGEAYLFGSILNEFLSQYVTINGFSRLTVRALRRGEIHEWPIHPGARTAI